MFWVRLISGIVLLAILISCIVFSSSALTLLSTFVCIIGLYEFYRLKNIQFSIFAYISYGFTILYYGLYNFFADRFSLQIIAGFFIVVALTYVILYPKRKPEEITHIIFGMIYITLMFSFIIRVRDFNMGDVVVVIIFIASWGTDTLAYVTGLLFGKHKLVPNLSPKKSIEGAIGGTLGSVLLSYIYVMLVERIYYKSTDIYDVKVYLYIMAICLIASVVSQFGDLFASAFKRHFGIKDYGNLIPGHGGVLDRFDSVLFTAPTIYIILTMFI